MEGFLTKQGHMVKNWKVRWFTLENNELTYYKDQTKFLPKGKCILLNESSVESCADIDVHKNIIQINIQASHMFGIGRTSVVLSADNPQNKGLWLEAIQAAITRVQTDKLSEENYNKVNIPQNNSKPAARQSITRTSESSSLPPKTTTNASPNALNNDDNEGSDQSDTEEFSAFNKPKRGNNKNARNRRLNKNTKEVPSVAPANVFDLDNIQQETQNISEVQENLQRHTQNTQNKQKNAQNSTPGATATASHRNSSGGRESFELPRVSEIATHNKKMTKNDHAAKETRETTPSQPATTPLHFDCELPSFGTPSPAADAEEQEDCASAGGKKPKQKAKKTNLFDNWVEVQTEDGQTYYYHKTSRVTRWDRPEPHIMEAMESRLEESQKTEQRNIRERKLQMERDQEIAEENERIIDEAKISNEKSLAKWRKNKRTQEDYTFPELLKNLSVILPNDLLVNIYDSPNKAIFDSLSDLVGTSDPTLVKKTYLKVVRFIHPDKLPSSLDIESKLLAERIFILLSEKFDLYRKAHSL